MKNILDANIFFYAFILLLLSSFYYSFFNYQKI